MRTKTNHNFLSGIWVYVLLALAILSIVNLGLFSYNKISDALNNLKSRINEDIELSSVKNIRLNYIKLDNMMEMYLITNKMFYLNQFDTLANRTKKTITTLKQSKLISPYEAALLDSLKTTVNYKIENLDYIILYEQNVSIENSINDLLERNSSGLGKMPSFNTKPKKGKVPTKSFADRIGLKHKKYAIDSFENNQARNNQTNARGEVVIRKKDLFDIRQSANVNPNLENDKELNEYFMDLCRVIESIETNRLDQERIVSEKKIKQANQSILMLGISTTLFLILAAIVYFRYIKRLSEVRKNLADSKEVAEEMTLLKERFMANMSHEIRTPMNAISGFVDQLQASNLTVIQKRQIGIIQKSITHVLNIINDILDFSKLNAGKLTLDFKGMKIHHVIYQTIEIVQPLLAEKHLLLSCDIDEKMPSVLIGDTYRLRQILLNIIGNAIKYTHEGSIDVKATVIPEENNVFLVKITVQDSGIGIAKEELSQIFKEYHMADNSNFSKAGSSGLGLNITKMLVELYNGQISVESTLNKGTTVTIYIPFRGGTELDLAKENRFMSDRQFLNGKKILIADDEPFNRVLLHNILEKYNVIPYEAVNGEEVLNLIEKEQFDCILMDLKMPELNGLETSQRIRHSENTAIKNIPIIALSAAITNEHFNFLHGIGVTAFLEKPFKEIELLNLLFKVLDKGDHPLPLETMPFEMNETQASQHFDLSDLQRQSGSDVHFINDMLNTLINSTQKGLLEIEDALVNKDWETINQTAHRIASPLKYIYATELYDLIKQIEVYTEPKVDKNIDMINHQFNRFKAEFNTLTTLIQDYMKNA